MVVHICFAFLSFNNETVEPTGIVSDSENDHVEGDDGENKTADYDYYYSRGTYLLTTEGQPGWMERLLRKVSLWIPKIFGHLLVVKY